MKKSLTKTESELIGMHDGIQGNVSGLRGNVSGIRGNVSGIRGNLMVIAYGKNGMITYRLNKEQTRVIAESNGGNDELAYDLAGRTLPEKIKYAVKCLRRDGWPLDKTK